MEHREAVATWPNGERIDNADLLGNPIAVGRLMKDVAGVPCAQDDLSKAIADVYAKHNQPVERTFEQFTSLVRDSVDGQAARKGYTANGADGDNALFKFTKEIGIADHHSVGEMIYKLVEYVKEPREVILIKVAGWSFMIWKYFKR